MTHTFLDRAMFWLVCGTWPELPGILEVETRELGSNYLAFKMTPAAGKMLQRA